MDQLPTATDIEELIDIVKRDPNSPKFVDLARAYLMLGRPKDAIAVANRGLLVNDANADAHLVLGKAMVSLHQWKEAQNELHKVAKADNGNAQAFALLGEVLLRRDDYDRALPVLQHAQNLDPTSPTVLALLKRARARLPLDPPPPPPTAVPPRGEAPAAIVRSGEPVPPPTSGMRAPVSASRAPVSASRAPVSSTKNREQAPPQAIPDGVRPRVLGEKEQNAAHASLRQSAAVGENYLNDLLTGGLLQVGTASAPQVEYDLRPDQKYGRTARRAFILLFALLFAGIGGGTAWYLWSKKQRQAAVAKLHSESRLQAALGDFTGLEAAVGNLGNALKKDKGNALTFAYIAEVTGVEALVYGTDTGRVADALLVAERNISPGGNGWGEVTVGRAAYHLARLARMDQSNPEQTNDAAKTLAKVSGDLDAFLKDADEQSHAARLAMWLKGRVLLANGQRKAAIAQFTKAGEGDAGYALAIVDHGDALVDLGDIAGGLAQYERVLKQKDDHPLAVLGRALTKAESKIDSAAALDDINVKLDRDLGPRVNAYRDLAMAFALVGQEDYPRAFEALGKASGVREPRFLARVAWLEFVRGNLAKAAAVQSSIAWYGSGKPEEDPPSSLVNAGLLLSSGLPAKTLDLAEKLSSNRAKLLAIYALIDLAEGGEIGRAKEAASRAEELLAVAPDDMELAILRDQAKMLGSTGKDREAASASLERLARKAKTKLGRYALGMAQLNIATATNNAELLSDAKRQLTQSLDGISDDSPHPMAYRSHTVLGELLLAEGDKAGAAKQFDAALALNSGYFPTRAAMAKLKLASGDPQGALDLLAPIMEQADAVTAKVEFTFAEALATRPTATADDKKRAVEILTRIKGKIQPATEVGRVLFALDPALPATLDVPVPEGLAPAPAPKPARRRRGR